MVWTLLVACASEAAPPPVALPVVEQGVLAILRPEPGRSLPSRSFVVNGTGTGVGSLLTVSGVKDGVRVGSAAATVTPDGAWSTVLQVDRGLSGPLTVEAYTRSPLDGRVQFRAAVDVTLD